MLRSIGRTPHGGNGRGRGRKAIRAPFEGMDAFPLRMREREMSDRARGMRQPGAPGSRFRDERGSLAAGRGPESL